MRKTLNLIPALALSLALLAPAPAVAETSTPCPAADPLCVPPPNCQAEQLEVQSLERRLHRAHQVIDRKKATIARLRAQLAAAD